jgi:hypothetical protein
MAEQISDAAYFILENEEIFQPANEDNIHVVLGMPKSGKTALIKVLTNDLSNILAVGNNNYMNIFDRNDLAKSNSYTEDFIPEVYKDEYRNVYYDIPGFKYVKNASIDITAGYFTKKVFDSADKVKIILTIPHYKIRYSEYIDEIKQLFIHCGKLIRQYKRFTNSVSLVVTMVDKTEKSRENGTIDNITYKTDNEIKSDISEYLKYLKKNITEYDHIYRDQKPNLMKLIDILTYSKNNITYNHIGLLKKPAKEGPLNLDSEIQESKKNLLDMIEDNLKFSTVKRSDTRYLAFHFENDEKNWYKYYTYFMEGGAFLKMIFTFFKLVR